MGCIYQASSGISDNGLVTMSFWCRPPDAAHGAAGKLNLMYLFYVGGLQIYYTTSGSPILFTVNGASNTNNVEWRARPDSIIWNGWNHFYIALDATPGGNSDKCYFYINLVRQPLATHNVSGDTYSTSTTAPYDNGFYDFSVPIAFAFNGFDIGIPTIPSNLTGTFGSVPTIQYSDFQAWVGTFINPTISGNLNKFVSVTNNVGKPVSPATAATAFGTQTLLFKGGASSFSTNNGSGGAFIKSGTVSDFTPTPTY